MPRLVSVLRPILLLYLQEGDGDRPKSSRNLRYKDRPDRAIYNPGARAAERRLREQATSKTSSDDSKTE